MSKRIQVILSEELDNKILAYSQRYGISKSSFVGFVLGQWIDNMERLNNTVHGASGQDGIVAQILNKIAEDSKDIIQPKEEND